jgi:hypothetical protein
LQSTGKYSQTHITPHIATHSLEIKMTLAPPSEELELRPSDLGVCYDAKFEGMTGKIVLRSRIKIQGLSSWSHAEMAGLAFLIAAQATQIAFDADRTLISSDCENRHKKTNPGTSF